VPRFAANLTFLFNERPFLERFAAARQAGFAAVEYLFPYDHDKEVLKQKLEENGLVQALHNLPAGNWSAGERGIACHPDRVREFEEGVETAIDYAAALGCPRVNCLAGVAPRSSDPAAVRETFVRNLHYAAPRFRAAGIKLLIEPINTRDIPGFFLCGTRQAMDIIEAVGSDNLFLQYDIYHAQIMEGDLAHTIERHLGAMAHIQIADPPGRNEPGTGEINFPFLFGLLDRLGYAGWIGCEYKPQGRTEDHLSWARPYLTAASGAPSA
jgi:hydroxypyruvate isomerase